MNRYQLHKPSLIGVAALACVGWLAADQTTEIKGLIISRSGANLVLKTSDSPALVVQLTDRTEVGQIQGMLKVRSKEMSMAFLIPGLAVQVEATHGEHNQLVAKSVKFKGNDLKKAQAIDAGLHETRAQTKQNTAEIEKHNAELKAQNEALKQQQQELMRQSQQNAQQQQQIAEQQRKIAENRAAVNAAIARFGQLDDYYILDEVTLLFANGNADVDPKYHPQLLQLAEKAKTIDGYMIEIKGYASSVGSTAKNQELSEERAENVADILVQQGHIPFTHLVAPGGMGESQQIGNQKTAQGQAQNRRVVVRVLQNKGIVGSLTTGG
ncbi:MAG TPA: OmpA family protein [Bryobacteraceae bacterium]